MTRTKQRGCYELTGMTPVLQFAGKENSLDISSDSRDFSRYMKMFLDLRHDFWRNAVLGNTDWEAPLYRLVQGSLDTVFLLLNIQGQATFAPACEVVSTYSN